MEVCQLFTMRRHNILSGAKRRFFRTVWMLCNLHIVLQSGDSSVTAGAGAGELLLLWQYSTVLSSVLFVHVCLLTLSVPHACSTVSTGLSVYRNKTAFSHFAAAGAFTGGLFRVHLGLSRMAAGSVFGAAFGIPAGGLLLAVQKLAGETIQEKRTRERRLLHEQKLAEWKARLNVTEADLEEIVSNTQEGTMERDIEKIQELLNLPKNPLPSEDRN
ncbi:complex I assembly factor TIMMDC1, mitochondrial isoform X2 [Lepidochelys kempii]|uniref:complex I assembly factor TIMMDC1, mitochondrial isoform X2 n=1 Tax=Lepidochelys kempii TaxID=8472 RepID=UPI003C6FB21C